MIKAVTGKENWRTAPATTLEDANNHITKSAVHLHLACRCTTLAQISLIIMGTVLIKTDEEVLYAAESILEGQPVTILQVLEKSRRNELLRRMKEIDGASQRQLARITGINQSTISHA